MGGREWGVGSELLGSECVHCNGYCMGIQKRGQIGSMKKIDNIGRVFVNPDLQPGSL